MQDRNDLLNIVQKIVIAESKYFYSVILTQIPYLPYYVFRRTPPVTQAGFHLFYIHKITERTIKMAPPACIKVDKIWHLPVIYLFLNQVPSKVLALIYIIQVFHSDATAVNDYKAVFLISQTLYAINTAACP